MRAHWILALPLAAAAVVALVLFTRHEPAQAPLPDGRSAEPAAALEPPASEAEPLDAVQEPGASREAAQMDQDALELPGAQAVSEIDPRSPPVRLHGTLLDQNTRLPLPEFELSFEVAGEGEGPQRRASARTDAQGRFECAEPILVARCLVRYLDRQGHRRLPPPATLELEDVRKGELALSVAWGPTYRLAFAPKDAIEPAGVDLRLRSSGARGRGTNPTEWEPAHAGDPPWVRFAPLAAGVGKVEKLEARTRDGLWSGEAAADAASGLAPGVTLVSFEMRAVLDGTVRDADQHTIADADVLLQAADAEARPVQRNARTSADGHFRFEQLPACMGTLRVVSVRHTPWSQGVTLLAGQEQKLPVLLAALDIAGAIGVRVESESGRYAPAFTLVLALENDPQAEAGGERFVRQVRAQWSEEAGRKVARFLFPDLPRQLFRIGVQKDDFFAWDPQQQTLQPPAEDARILIRDGIPNASLAFRLEDRGTGEVLPGFELTLEFPGTRTPPRRLGGRSGKAFLAHLPLDRKLSWRVDAQGHAPALGDLSAFQVVERVEDGELRVCERELRPGWGESYRFVDTRNRAGLEGIRVLLDGVEAGVSAAGGRVLVQAAAQPARIEYKCDELGIKTRPLKPERRVGCSAEVRVAPAQPQKKGKG